MSHILQSGFAPGITLKDADCWVSVVVFRGLADVHWDIHRFPTWFALRLSMKDQNIRDMFRSDYHQIELDLKQMFLNAPLDDTNNYIISEVKSIFDGLKIDPVSAINRNQLRFRNQNDQIALTISYGRK